MGNQVKWSPVFGEKFEEKKMKMFYARVMHPADDVGSVIF